MLGSDNIKKQIIRKKNEFSNKNENKNLQALKIFRTQSMLVSDNVSVRQCQDLVNARVTECQSQTIGAEHKLF